MNLIDLARAVDAAERERVEHYRVVRSTGAAGPLSLMRAQLGAALVSLGQRLIAAGKGPPPRLRSSTPC